jgi:hypothetical protein
MIEYRTVAMTRPRSEARVRIDIFDDLLISLVLARAMEEGYHF